MIKFEHRDEPLLPMNQWIRRVAQSVWLAVILIGVALGIGISGYHWIGGLGWIDAFLEASMILAGMGPVAPLANNAVKIFAALYALMSGLVIIGTTGILLGPWLHRLLHVFHSPAAKSK